MGPLFQNWGSLKFWLIIPWLACTEEQDDAPFFFLFFKQMQCLTLNYISFLRLTANGGLACCHGYLQAPIGCDGEEPSLRDWEGEGSGGFVLFVFFFSTLKLLLRVMLHGLFAGTTLDRQCPFDEGHSLCMVIVLPDEESLKIHFFFLSFEPDLYSIYIWNVFTSYLFAFLLSVNWAYVK